jgi:hypothetical protein
MKQFLQHYLFTQFFIFLTVYAVSQTTLTYTTPGTYQWVCPVGVTSVSLQMWGGGGAGVAGSSSGGGGAFLQTTSIPVQFGTTYNIIAGAGALSYTGGASSFGPAGGSTIVSVQGGNTSGISGGAASSGSYVSVSYQGGSGVYTADYFSTAGGGAGAGTCGPGADGSASSAGVGNCGGGSGGDPNGANGGQGNPPGGGGAGGPFYVNAFGGNGEVVLTYTCSPGIAGAIGNAHTIPYPPEFIPDSVKNITAPTAVSGMTIAWQQSTDDVNFVSTKTPASSFGYRFDKDSLQTTTYYRRGNNACVEGGGYGNWSDTVKITVFTSKDTGRNGNVTGFVKSNNGSPIINRKVYAQSLTPLKGRRVGFLDSTFTDGQGHFSIDSIFFGDRNNGDSANVRFLIYPDTSKGHKFNPANAIVSLSALHFTYDLSSSTFFDTTVLAISGQVTQTCQGCLDSTGKVGNIIAPLDSVFIRAVGQHSSSQNPEKDSTKTGFVNPPGKYGRYVLTVQNPDQYTVTPTFKAHKFVPADSVFSANNNVNNINFKDTTTHVISGFYGAGCNDSIGTAVLEFDDVLPNGVDSLPRASVCRKQVTTSANGQYSIRLPARPYTVKIISAKVSDPLDPSTTQASIKAFFKAVPASSLFRDITNHDTVLNLIYNRSPHIAVSGLNADSNRVSTCSAFKNFDFWPQGIRRPITFKVYQGPVSRGCLLDTGNVFVTTDISSTLGVYNHDTVNLAKGVGVDSIVGAQPNTVIIDSTRPYSKKFTATFTDILNRSVSTDTSKPALPVVVVTGAAVDPNSTNFVTVSPQIPFLVLHDPPGNTSLSEWSQTTSSQQAISFQSENQKSVGGFLNVNVGLDEIVGLFVETEVKVWASLNDGFSTTNTTSNTNETVIAASNQTTISTSDGGNFVGPDADVVYGAALNINYRIGTEVDWDSAHCKLPPIRSVLVMGLKNDTTSYTYTIGHIKNELIPTLQQAAAATTNPDSATYFENQIGVWQQLVANNQANLQKAPFVRNLSIGNGQSQGYSSTLTNSTTNSYNFNLEIDNTIATELGFEIAGNGLSGGFNVGFKMSTGGSTSSTSETSTTTSYTLSDDNSGGANYEGDYISVNVKKDPVYGTPMFETVSGGTQCPYEAGTIPLDNPVITANVQSQTNVKKDTANFIVNLNNLSKDATPNGSRPYILFLNPSSNPNGAGVKAGSSDLQSTGVVYTVPNNSGTQPVTISVIRNTAGGVFNYDNLQLIMSDPCFGIGGDLSSFFSNPHQYSTINLSADFASPVSGATIVTPANNWVANQASNNLIPVTFNGYDTSKLASIGVQFNIPGQSTWTTLKTFTKKQLGATSTNFSWNISAIADGPINIRLIIKDKLSNTVYSLVSPGLIARTPPALYGTPQPANSIYAAGTQISYSYTENIVTTNLRSSMVKFKDLTSNTAAAVQLSAFGNTMIIVPSGNITTNVGHLYRVIVDSVSDLYGNIKTAPDTSYFTVQSSNLSTGSDALNIATAPSSILEDANGVLTISFTRKTAVSDTVVIYYNLAGNAVYNKDYTVSYSTKGQSSATGISGFQGAILMPKDSSKVTMFVHPVNDSILSPNKILSITLSQGGGYSLGTNYTVSDTILNHNTVKPVITASKPSPLCPSDSVTLSTANTINGVAVKSFLWSTGAKTQSIVVKTSGSFTVKVTDKNGLTGFSDPSVVTFVCGAPSGLKATVLTKNSAAVSWPAASCAVKYVVQYRQVGKTTWKTDTVNKAKDTLKALLANTSYQWQVATICQYPVIVVSGFTAGTNFTTPVSLTDIVTTSAEDYKIATAGDGFNAEIYPNPASNIANLSVRNMKGKYSVMVESLQGAVLWQASQVSDSDLKIPLGNFAQGVYMVIINDKTHKGTLKLVKE